jgi:hypothetical protein
VATIKWEDDPEDHDYPAATAYLSLLLSEAATAEVVRGLQAATTVQRKAKDILRASGLALLPKDNTHVAADLDKVSKGKSLSPILLVRGDACTAVPLQVADGYHRVCASYHLDENSNVPCRIADLPRPQPAATHVG